jgi:hypothetical protein
MNPYHALGLRTVINADGMKTRLGGSLMPPEVLAAMTAAGEGLGRRGWAKAVYLRAIARALAPLEPRLPGAVALDAAFGSPLLLGAAAAVCLRDLGGGALDLAVRTGHPLPGQRVHLAAALRPQDPQRPQGSSRWSTAEVTAP